MTAPTVELLDTAAARRLVSEARNALALADDLLARLFAGRAWEALGHADWPALCAAELPELRHLKLRAEPRRARVAALHALGASVRDIAAATGASVGSVHNDVRVLTAAVEVCAATPAVSVVDRIVGLLAEHPAGLDVLQVARRLRLRQAQVAPALCRLAAVGRVDYRPGPRRGAMGTYGLGE